MEKSSLSGGGSIMLTANQRWGAGMLPRWTRLVGEPGAAHSSVAATEPLWPGSSADPDSRLLFTNFVRLLRS